MIKDVQSKLENFIDLLPPIPAVMTELIQALGNKDIELRALASIISKDPFMSMNVLKVSNSAFYRLPNKVATVDHAVKLLGIKEITGICIACGAYQSLKQPENMETFALDDFWRHSVATGVVSRRLCQELEILDHNVFYFLGLLHDVGKVVLDRFAHDIYRIVVQTTREEHITIQEAEKHLIGESHDVVGGWLMEKWRLPLTFVDVAKYHHSMKESPEDNKAAIAIISLADRLSWLHYLGLDPGYDVSLLTDNEAYSFLEETTSAMEEIDLLKFIHDIDTAREEIDEMTRIFHS